MKNLYHKYLNTPLEELEDWETARIDNTVNDHELDKLNRRHGTLDEFEKELELGSAKFKLKWKKEQNEH